MTKAQIKRWLRLVGKDFNIKEIWEQRRPDDALREPRDYLVYFKRSTRPVDDHAKIDRTESDQDHITTISKKYQTMLDVELHQPYDKNRAESQDGMRILQSLEMSLYLPEMKDVFGGSIEIKRADDITTEPWFDESDKATVYSVTFEFEEWVTYTRTETDAVVQALDMNGVIEDAEANQIDQDIDWP